MYINIKPGLYQPIPVSVFKYKKANTITDNNLNVFIEYDFLKNHVYRANMSVITNMLPTMLDCSVGIHADITVKSPTLPPTTYLEYLQYILELQPSMFISPDVLGDSAATENIFRIINDIIEYLPNKWLNELGFVIQGSTLAEADYQITEIAVQEKNISRICIPRVVRYFNHVKYLDLDPKTYADNRLNFLEKHVKLIKSSGKQIHLLGMNSVDELIYAAQNQFTIDSRFASLAVLNNFEVTGNRPAGKLKDDFLADLNKAQVNNIILNMLTLNQLYIRNYK